MCRELKKSNNWMEYVRRLSLYIEKARDYSLTNSLAQEAIGHYCYCKPIITQDDFQRKEIFAKGVL